MTHATSPSPSPETVSPRTALISGATSGLGWEFALLLAQLGTYNLILTGRREDRLEALRQAILERPNQGWVKLLPADLSERASREALIAEVRALSTPLNLLVNNAGFGTVGPFLERGADTQGNMVQVNCEAPVHLCAAFLPTMGQGDVVLNVASTAAFQPIPLMATYAATKSFLHSFSVALDAEMGPNGPRVLCLCPGPTLTEFHLVSGLPDKMEHLPVMSAEEVVQLAMRAVERKQGVFVPGSLNRFLVSLARLLPPWLSARAAQRAIRRSIALSGE